MRSEHLRDYAVAVAGLLRAYCAQALPREEVIAALRATGLTEEHATAIVAYGIEHGILEVEDATIKVLETSERVTPMERRTRRQGESRARNPRPRRASDGACSPMTEEVPLDVRAHQAVLRARSEIIHAEYSVAKLQDARLRAAMLINDIARLSGGRDGAREDDAHRP